MPSRGRVRRRFRLTMRGRIFGGFAITLVLIVLLAGVIYRASESGLVVASSVLSGIAASDAATELALRVGDAHARAMQFASTGNALDQRALADSLARLDSVVRSSTGVSSLGALLARYRNAVDATAAAVQARNDAIAAWQTAGTDLRTIATAVSQLLDRESDAEALRAGMRLVDAFQTSDGAGSRFRASRNPADANTAGSAFDTFSVFASSVILPPAGSTGAATPAADHATVATASMPVGAVYVVWQPQSVAPPAGTSYGSFSLSDGTTANEIRQRILAGTTTVTAVISRMGSQRQLRLEGKDRENRSDERQHP